MAFYAAKDKNGKIHISNFKPMKPSEWMAENPDANDEIFWIPPSVNMRANPKLFFVEYNDDIEGLTFENSPKELSFTLK